MTDNEKRAHDFALALLTNRKSESSQVSGAYRAPTTSAMLEEYLKNYQQALEFFNQKL